MSTPGVADMSVTRRVISETASGAAKFGAGSAGREDCRISNWQITLFQHGQRDRVTASRKLRHVTCVTVILGNW
jgi:hypothetical protein